MFFALNRRLFPRISNHGLTLDMRDLASITDSSAMRILRYCRKYLCFIRFNSICQNELSPEDVLQYRHAEEDARECLQRLVNGDRCPYAYSKEFYRRVSEAADAQRQSAGEKIRRARERERYREAIGYVYVIRKNGLCKIGKTKDPSQRIKSFGKSEVIRVLSCRYNVDEKRLHEHFAGKRIEGEWFKLDEEDFSTIDSLLAVAQ